MKERRRIPTEQSDRLLASNRHTCCVCREPRHPVERHHIDGNPSNNEWNNLAIVCRNCHGLVTAKGNLGANYTPGEVLHYKQIWEKRCAEAKDDIDSPIEEIQETKVIDADDHEIYEFDMEEGDDLVFSVDAEECVDLVICEEENFDDWADGEVNDEERPLPDGYWHRTDVLECGEYQFTAPHEGRFVLLVINWDDEPTEVTVDAAVWAAEE